MINKLETLLEQQINKQHGLTNGQVFLSEENARLRARLKQLEEDRSDEIMTKQDDSKLLQQLELLQDTSRSPNLNSDVTEKLERSETRVRVLQEQLQLNASEWGIQKTQMEVEITRLRAQVTALIGQLQPANRTLAVGRKFSHNPYTGLSSGVTKPVSL